MTKEQFRELLNSVRVQTVSPYGVHRGGLYVEGLSQDDLAAIVTIAGVALGELKPDARVNPEWLALGPQRDIAFIVHREFAEKARDTR